MGLKRYFILAVVLLLATMAAPAGAGELQQQLTGESTLEQILQRGVLKVGMDTFVPWAMKDKKGELIGFEIDVATRLAQDMGVKVQFVPTQWDGIISALQTGKFDVIIGGMGIVPKRNIKVNFTIPYDYTGMSLVAHQDLAKGFSAIEDFNRPEITLAVKIGATPVMAARRFMPQAQLKQFNNEAQVYQELLNGRVHAVVASAPTPAFYALKYPDKLFLPFEGTFTREPIG
ncbi:MAG: transporter substrate-binding domain-containing protein, partial [Desulfobacteraceae bacterium]|nr:transporter substrate-binding domain-containing protein [Desulfobacteraceae bacterium]